MDVVRLVGLGNNNAPNLRNGVVAVLEAPSRRGAIDAKYHWKTIGGAAGRLDLSTIYVYVCYGALVAAEATLAAGAAVPDAGSMAAFNAIRPGAARLQVLRYEAIIIGGARAGAATAYTIVAGDLHADERSTGDYVTIDLAPANPTWAFTSGHTDAAGNLTSDEAATLSFGPLSADEESLFLAMAKVGMGIAGLVGSMLIETGHHYLSHASKAFAAVESQVIGALSAPAKAPWTADVSRSRDLAFHKALHPVSNGVLMGLARDVDLPLRLTAVSLGSAAVRLPYVEPEFKAARAMIAVVDSVQPFCEQSGFRVSVPRLKELLRHVLSYPVAGGAPTVPAPGGIQVMGGRAEAIRDVLVPAMNAAKPVVATATGMYVAILEVSGSNPGTDSRLLAFSVKKLRAEHPASVAAGAAAHRQYRTFERSAAERGGLATWAMTDELAAPATAPNGPAAAP